MYIFLTLQESNFKVYTFRKNQRFFRKYIIFISCSVHLLHFTSIIAKPEKHNKCAVKFTKSDISSFAMSYNCTVSDLHETPELDVTFSDSFFVTAFFIIVNFKPR